MGYQMDIKYGEEVLSFPEESGRILKELRPQGQFKPVDVLESFKHALETPTAGLPLVMRIANEKPHRIAIIVEDKTRKNPEYPLLLDELITFLNKVTNAQIYLVVAYGSHPEHSPEENERIYGSKNLARVTLINHNSREAENLVKIGVLSTGNNLFINRNIAEADLIISFGDITPHAFAGFSGGRKAILPGIAGYESIQQNHTLVYHPKVGLGMLDQNPLHLEMMEAAELARLEFIINFVRNSNGEIVSIVSGDFGKAFFEGVKICKEINSVRISTRADVVYVSCGGFPKDKSLYHAQRGIITAVNAVKQGGTIVVFGKFPEGVGDDFYETWLQKPLTQILSLEPSEIKLGVHSAYLMARNLSHADILLFTELDEALALKLHFRKMVSWNEIQSYIKRKHHSDYSAYVIPNGSQLLIEEA